MYVLSQLWKKIMLFFLRTYIIYLSRGRSKTKDIISVFQTRSQTNYDKHPGVFSPGNCIRMQNQKRKRKRKKTAVSKSRTLQAFISHLVSTSLCQEILATWSHPSLNSLWNDWVLCWREPDLSQTWPDLARPWDNRKYKEPILRSNAT